MTTLYRPVPIESAEQAAQMPDGSMAYCDAPDAYGKPCRSVAGKHRGAWWSADRELPVAGWTALVPIEAEEERTRPVHLYAATVHVSPTSSSDKPSRRLVTPWEEA